MRYVAGRLVLSLLVIALALGPVAAQAQATMDPATRATVDVAVPEVGRLIRPAAVGSTTAVVGPILLPTPTPSVVTTPEPEDEPTPEPTDEPTEEPTPQALTPFDPATAVTYESGPVTVQVPPEWEVEDVGDGEEAYLVMSIPDRENVFMVLQDSGDDFPGLVGLVLIPALADMLVAELGENGEVEAAEVVLTAQGLPMARIAFHGEMEGEDGGGTFNLISTGDTAFLIMAVGPLADWVEIKPIVEAIVNSVKVDEEIVTLVTPDSDDYYYVNDAGTIEVYVPNGWHASGSTNEELPVSVAGPNYEFAMMMATQNEFFASIDPELQALLETPVEEYTPEVIEEITTALLDEISSGGDFFIDDTQTEMFDYGDGVTLRFVGEGVMEDEMTVPVAIYFDQDSDGIAVALVMGDVEALLADEVSALDVVQSLTALE